MTHTAGTVPSVRVLEQLEGGGALTRLLVRTAAPPPPPRLIGGLGVSVHSLPLVYAGYGVLGGCGAGLSYVSPVSNMSKWFPDKRGLATGAAVMGFGGGAMVATPLDTRLLAYYSEVGPPSLAACLHSLLV